MKATLAARVAWVAVLSAGIAAALAAVVATVLVDTLLLRAGDHYLAGAGQQLAHEVEGLTATTDPRTLAARVDEEEGEATSAGIRMAVFTTEGQRLAGEEHVPFVARGCERIDGLRACAFASDPGVVVAATRSEGHAALYGAATTTAAVLAALVAWAIGRVLARRATAPLADLQARVANLASGVDLGGESGLVEVDALRDAMSATLLKMYDALERASRFAANATHELRTPLTALRTELELLAERSADAEAVRRAVRKVDQLHALIERLLVLALPETSPGTELISLRDVVDEVLSDLQADERARITFSGDEDVVVRGDEAELAIVISNGLTNALKFGTRVVVELDAARSTLAVDDDGPGIEEPDRAALFEPFVRGAGAHGLPGRGLGLALVAHVARRHHGEARLLGSLRHAQGTRLEVRIGPG